MPSLNNIIIEAQEWAEKYWDLGNDVLYKLCEDHPKHDKLDIIIAKMWLIGRAYSVSIERHRIKDSKTNLTFYETKLAPAIFDKRSQFDEWSNILNNVDSQNESNEIIYIHKEFVTFLNTANLSKDNLVSFVSKYLHFHFHNLFYIFDSRAQETLNKDERFQRFFDKRDLRRRIRDLGPEKIDTKYAYLVLKCRVLKQKINENDENFAREFFLTPRQIDNLLFYLFSNPNCRLD